MSLAGASMPHTPPPSSDSTVVRYSARPREAYDRSSGGRNSGPGDSALLDLTEAWNLAFLSHDFDRQHIHPDFDFTVLVRRTAQTRLDGTGVDLTFLEAPALIASWLRLPAPRFVALVKRHPVLHDLPLFQRYGANWLDTIEQRSRLCHSADDAVDDDSTVLPAFEQMARQVLARYQVARR
jgi:hypothetical protein